MNGLSATIRNIVPQNFRPLLKKTIYSLRSIYFSGSDLTCPFCNGHFRQMIPFGLDFPVLKEKEIIGGGYRENCLCPRCNSADRERLAYLYLLHETNLLDRHISILHIAPEVNLGNFLKSGNYIYLSGDLDSPLAMMKMDITEIPFEDNIYDLIICNHVLEHVPDDRKAMSEMYRVLKPGGIAILQVPVSRILKKSIENIVTESEEEKMDYFGQKDHVRIYAANEYVSRLEQAGFLVEEFDWTSSPNMDPVHNRYSLNPAERLFVAKKP